MERYVLEYEKPAQQVIAHIVERLHQGDVGIVPTDTVYGLLGVAGNIQVEKRLYEIKQRPSHKMFVLHVADVVHAEKLFCNMSDAAEQLMHTFWPGPLTIICNASAYVRTALGYAHKTIAVRIPNHPVMLALLERMDVPLLVTSANISGKEIATNVAALTQVFRDTVDFIVDDGRTYTDVPSTIMDCTGKLPVVVREGVIRREQLK